MPKLGLGGVIEHPDTDWVALSDSESEVATEDFQP